MPRRPREAWAAADRCWEWWEHSRGIARKPPYRSGLASLGPFFGWEETVAARLERVGSSSPKKASTQSVRTGPDVTTDGFRRHHSLESPAWEIRGQAAEGSKSCLLFPAESPDMIFKLIFKFKL